ncbi:kinesin light chain [Cladorrhinum sp. PSN332]|nr:kinesin light chain [Cladorrhinum sp. PSN332]
MSLQVAGPAQPAQSLRAKIDRMIDRDAGLNPKETFIREIWPALRDDYEDMRSVLEQYCKDAIKSWQSTGIPCQISSRTKTGESIQKSLVRREEALKQRKFNTLREMHWEIHDLVGLRIVLEFSDDMEEAVAFIRTTFRKERDPTVFSRDRKVGKSWDTLFGAYHTRNYRVSVESGNFGTFKHISRFCSVLFEIQLTTLSEDLYNKLAHPLLYKDSSGTLTQQDEIVIDMSHGLAMCYALCIRYMKDRLARGQDAATSQRVFETKEAQVVADATRFVESLTGQISSPATTAPEAPPLDCRSIGDLKEWLSKKLDDMNCPRALRSRVEWEDAPFIVPYTSNPTFVGRSEILDHLKQRLGHSRNETEPNNAWQPRASLYGLGGIGKTQIALAYVYRLRSEYPDISVFWVHASNLERFKESYTSIAEECGVSGYDDPKVDILALVKSWLERKDGREWLMVLDNADDKQLFDPPNGLGNYIPDCARGSLIITTRNKQAGLELTGNRADALIEVAEMNNGESRQLLQKRLEGFTVDSTLLSTLSSKLDNLPLAMAQAAAYMQQAGISVERYLKLLEKDDRNLAELLEKEFTSEGRDRTASCAVAKTWIISFERIQSQDPFAGELLSLMSFFDRQAIPQEFLHNYNNQQEDQEPRGDVQFGGSLGLLKAFSFITEQKDETLTMHRLVQLVTRRWLDQNKSTPRFVEQAIRALAKAYPHGNKFENREKCGKYLPHVHAVLVFKSSGSRSEILARSSILHRTGSYFRLQGRWERAIQFGKQAVDIRTEVLGEEHPNTLSSMNELALTYRNQCRWKEIEPMQIQILEINKRVLGEEYPNTLGSMSNLAATYMGQGRWKEAESMQIQVLELNKRVLGQEDPDTLASMNNLALTYRNQGRWKEAESMQIQVLEIRRRVLGKEHPDTLISMINLASTYMDQGRRKEAESIQIQVLEISRRVLGKEHPDTLASMSKLASTYMHQGRWKEAESMLIQALEISGRVLGKEHPDTLNSMHNLAFTWKEERTGFGEGFTFRGGGRYRKYRHTLSEQRHESGSGGGDNFAWR